jgi:hypothetical protein
MGGRPVPSINLPPLITRDESGMSFPPILPRQPFSRLSFDP